MATSHTRTRHTDRIGAAERSGDRACQLAKMVLAHRFQKLSCVAEKRISSCSNQREVAEVEMDGAEQENNSCTCLAAHI